ncbi:MAG: hypothetical protein NTU53_03795 [Planctomycetota bacterium]|nr:hypothetical protein [Planctomycetota bacterium]
MNPSPNNIHPYPMTDAMPPFVSPCLNALVPFSVYLLTSVFSLLLASAASAQAPDRRDIFAQGSRRTPVRNAHIWVAAIATRPDPDPKTLVLSREVFGDSKWKEYSLVPARVIAITHHSGELVLLLQNRSWAWFSATEQTERFSYGPLLPEKATILALAGDYDSLFGLGQFPRPAATVAESAPSPPSTLPTTRPAAPAFFRLQGTSWKQLPTPWPPDAPPIIDSNLLSLDIIADQPHLAVLCPDNFIRVYQLSKDNSAWLLLSTIPAPPRFQHHKLLDLGGRPALWLQTDSGPGALVVDGHSTPLTLPPPLPATRDMDLTVAGDQLRLIFSRDSKFHEQRYKLSGSTDGQLTQFVTVSRRTEPPITWVAMATMTVLAIFMVITFLRRRPAPPDKESPDDPER